MCSHGEAVDRRGLRALWRARPAVTHLLCAFTGAPVLLAYRVIAMTAATITTVIQGKRLADVSREALDEYVSRHAS